jgi:hypothetical protein
LNLILFNPNITHPSKLSSFRSITTFPSRLNLYHQTDAIMQTRAESNPRLFEADLIPKTYTLPFNGNQYKARLQITAYGHPLYRSVDCSMILIEKGETSASKHFGKITEKCPELRHGNRNLRDNIQVY